MRYDEKMFARIVELEKENLKLKELNHLKFDYVNADYIDSVMAENVRLKELNGELIKLLKRVNEVIIEYQSGLTSEYLVEIIEPVLAKALEVDNDDK